MIHSQNLARSDLAAKVFVAVLFGTFAADLATMCYTSIERHVVLVESLGSFAELGSDRAIGGDAAAIA